MTGAASGMGAATAKRFAAEGATVWLVDVLDDDGRAVVTDIESLGGKARFHHLDVVDEAAWQALVAEVVSTDGQLTILVNNAGITGTAPDDIFDSAVWHSLLAVNATGMFYGAKHASRAMIEGGSGGAITNMSSVSAFRGGNGVHPGYNASKGAVLSLTKVLAVQLAPHKIRVNSLHPGVMPAMRGSRNHPDPEFRSKIVAAKVPLGRMGTVEDAANAVLFLSSDEASYITGAELYVDGGTLAT